SVSGTSSRCLPGHRQSYVSSTARALFSSKAAPATETYTLSLHDALPIYPYPMRIITVGGDSVVTEVGPYPSILRPGQTATTRFVGHYHGSKMTGTFEAHYPSGDVVKGKVAATRKK